jgi:hypothetical protein
MANETKVIDSGISVKHAKNWSAGEAIREIVQNYLDVRSEFNCGGEISYNADKGCAYVRDLGPGLKIEHLAFGNNDKAEGSIGQFGEGLKSAFVTLVRDNRRIEILSNGVVIRPFFKVSENFGVDTLHYKIQHCSNLPGTRIRVWCSESELEEGKLFFAKLDKEFKWVVENRVSLPGGNIYVNGSKIGSLPNSVFSYHLNGDEAMKAINRDRNAVDMNIITPLVISIINHTTSDKVAYTLLKKLFVEKADCYESTLNLYSYSDRIWLTAWHKLYKKDYVLPGETEENTAAGYRGYKILHNVGQQGQYFLSSFGVKSAADILKRPSPKKSQVGKVNPKSLEEVEFTNFKWAIKVVKKYYADPGKVCIGTDLNALTGSIGDARSIGCRCNDTGITWLAREILCDQERTLHTLLHETVHAVSNESDLTSEFEHALLQVAVRMIMDKGK